MMQFVPGKIFLGGMSPDTNNESLQAYCGQWGELTDVHIMMGKNYGFVTFSDPANAQQFLDTREHVIDGKQVDAKAAVPKDQGGGRMTKKMFVGGTIDITDAEFREYFSRFGTIEDATILRKPDGSSRGYGFVTFEDEICVEKCLVQEHSLNGHALDCKRANPKDKDGGPGGQGGGHRGGMNVGMGGGMGGQMMGMGGGQQQGMMGAMNPMMGMMGGPGMGMMYPMGMGGMNPMAAAGMMGGGGGQGGGGGTGAQGKQPEWSCNQCGNTNFGWRQYCNKCKQMRPGGGGGGGNVGNAMMGGGGAGGMMMNPNAANMAAMQMPMGMMGGMGPGGMNMMGGAGAMGGGVGGMPGMMGGGVGMGMMPGMDGSMGAGMMGGSGGQGGGGDGGQGQDGGGYGRRMGGRGNANGQARFRPY